MIKSTLSKQEHKISLLKKSSITSIIGDWGMGKSTFSKALSKITLQRIFHIEKEKYLSAGIRRTTDDFLSAYLKALCKGNYIFDGNSYSLDDKIGDYEFIIERLHKSDAIVFFDGNKKNVKADYIKRALKIENGEEVRIGGSWNYTNDKEAAINGYFNRKKELCPKLEAFRDKMIILKNHEQINELLNLMISFE